jgi:hypothetical protein
VLIPHNLNVIMTRYCAQSEYNNAFRPQMQSFPSLQERYDIVISSSGF